MKKINRKVVRRIATKVASIAGLDIQRSQKMSDRCLFGISGSFGLSMMGLLDRDVHDCDLVIMTYNFTRFQHLRSLFSAYVRKIIDCKQVLKQLQSTFKNDLSFNATSDLTHTADSICYEEAKFISPYKDSTELYPFERDRFLAQIYLDGVKVDIFVSLTKHNPSEFNDFADRVLSDMTLSSVKNKFKVHYTSPLYTLSRKASYLNEKGEQDFCHIIESLNQESWK